MSRTRQTASPITTEESNSSATGSVSDRTKGHSVIHKQLMDFGQERHNSFFCLKIEIAPNKSHFGIETGGCHVRT